MSDDPGTLNLRAYMALAGSSHDWRGALVRVLRSDAELDDMLRNRLADLIDNVSGDGPRLELIGHKAVRDRFAGVVSRHRWMEVGRWVAAYERPATSPLNAAQAAAEHFGLGVKMVESAVTYYNKSTVWVDRAMESEAGQQLGREWVERLYHSIIVYPDMKRVNADLIAQLGLSH